MTDSLQSSCDCYKCNKNNYTLPTGTPSNLSVPHCIVPDLYECHSTHIFKRNIEPNNISGTVWLNPQVLDQTNDTYGFGKVAPCGKACPTSYTSMDPRLKVPVRGMQISLDRPPFDSSVPLNQLNDKKELDNYGQKYNTYSDIEAGQVSYFINKERQDPFYSPLFEKQAHSIGDLYKDPMDNMKPHYSRIPIGIQQNPATNLQCDARGEYGLSWIRDSQDHRQDLLASQMAKINQERWAPRWTNIQQNVKQSVPIAYNC